MELSIDEIRQHAFDTLKHFRDFCQVNNIKYFLSNGTLLGAIKYKGFIPWDDDIDVLVPREDYNKLIKIYKDNDRYKLFSIEREPLYRYPFAKLCDVSTVKIEDNMDNGVELGIDIDIFPLDSCSKDIFSFITPLKHKYYQIGCILSKFVSSKEKNIIKRIIIEYCKLRGFDYYFSKLNTLVITESQKGSEFNGCLMWPVYGKKEIIPAKVFEKHIMVTFLGESFSAPIGYDFYLRSLYGDYKKDPPLSKQSTHHNFIAYGK